MHVVKLSTTPEVECFFECFLRLSDVTRRVGLSKSYIYAAIQAGKFPAPVKIGGKASRWRESAIVQWMSAQEKVRP